jgi:hypothetical protein
MIVLYCVYKNPPLVHLCNFVNLSHNVEWRDSAAETDTMSVLMMETDFPTNTISCDHFRSV